MYKVIFSDLDATLLNDDKSISKKNLDAIAYAKSKGVKFLLCTGRLPYCYTMFKNTLDLSSAISTNGAIIFDEGKIINDQYLTNDIANAIIKYAVDNGLYQRIFTEDFLYLLNNQKTGGEISPYIDSGPISIEDALTLTNRKKVYKLAFVHPSHDLLLKVKKDLEDMNLDIEIVFSTSTFLEINLNGQNKGYGVKQYCKLCNIDIKDTIAVGDNENDISMLEVAGLACCPSNSIDEVKKIADYVSPCNNNEGAIADIIYRYIK